MLRVNLNEQDDQLEQSVKQTCSEVGRVTWVKVIGRLHRLRWWRW